MRRISYRQDCSRAGWSIVEVLVVIAVCGLLTAVALPSIQKAREAARQSNCRDHLRTWTVALHNYHDTYNSLPPAAVWRTDVTSSLALQHSKQVDRITRESWALLLLPFAGKPELAQSFDMSQSIGADANAAGRMTAVDLLTCATDHHNRHDNPYQIQPPGSEDVPLKFSRGNYAINGGTHNISLEPPSTAFPKGDFPHLEINEDQRQFQLWGNGIAGINKSFSLTEFANGQGTMVAFDEIRAGIHPLDTRGAWALGQIGASITWGHGVNGDAYGPNNQWSRADDILGCRDLHNAVGTETLLQEGMPCVDYVDTNQQATARSLHSGGVHVGFLDGSVRFISDRVDPGLWHVMHSRETPTSVLADDFSGKLAANNSPESDSSHTPAAQEANKVPDKELFSNTIGMSFAWVPAGEFMMGVPDVGSAADLPPECPAHKVRIPHPFLLGVHEVTREQFQLVMGRIHQESPGKGTESLEPDNQPSSGQTSLDSSTTDGHLPMTNVTWQAANSFCEQLSQMPAEQAAGRTYRLPTEAEWEYACRSGSHEAAIRSHQTINVAVNGESAGKLPGLELAPVGSFASNQFGLHDMRGNAWEWTADWYDRDYYARSRVDNPAGPAKGYLKVVRGSDWRFVGEPCQIDYPVMPPWKSNPFVGFRIVCDTSGQ